MNEPEDLRMAAVAQVTIMDARALLDELESIRLAYSKQLDALVLILKGFSDLFLELTDKTHRRKWLSKQIEKAEREANRQRIPAWFWRIDRELPVDDQLYRRARWLVQEKPGIHVDDVWDCLSDAILFSNIPCDSDVIQKAVVGVFNASSK